MASKAQKQAAREKAERIAAADTAATEAYQAAKVAPAKTQAEVDTINAGVKSATETAGYTYDPKKALTVENQVSINPDVATTENYATGTRVNTLDKPIDTDAFARLMNQLTQWGLGGLSDVITKLLKRGMDFEGIMSKIKYDNSAQDPNNPSGPKWNDAYTKRFAGNQARLRKGLNALDEREYLAQEDSYAETINAYGLKDMLSLDATKNQEKFADWMSKDISPDEFKGRIKTAFDEVLSLDPKVKENFQKWYPSLTNQDLVSYFLEPGETLEKLKTKAYAAQIGAAANMQGLTTDKESAEMYAQRGVRYEQAQQAYGDIAGAMPGGRKLSDIYKEENIDYNQKTAEAEYLGQSAEAKLKRNRLASKERAMFQGQSGVDSGSLNRASNF